MLKQNQKFYVRVIRASYQHYLNKGYDVGINKHIEISAEDLSPSSDVKVCVICDYCGSEFYKTYKKYRKQRECVQKDACYDCFSYKQKEVCLFKYNVESTLQLTNVKEKSHKTVLEKYGVDNVMQNKDCKTKLKKTMMSKYGCEHSSQSPQIKEKIKKTLTKKYGVHNPQGRYTYKYKFVNGVKVSKGQLKLANLLNGKINVFIGGYYADIVLEDKKIIVEYNGSGHDLSVKLNKITKGDFVKKEQERIKKFNALGWTCIVITNENENVLSVNLLNEINNLINSSTEITTIYKNIE